jgi:glycosyltransferase involved in cell wall biosynthesis
MTPKRITRKILFVCHVASMSGAPLLLLEIIKSFKKQSKIPFSILIIKDGILMNQFKSLGKTYLWNCKLREPSGNLFNRSLNVCIKTKQKIYRLYILFRIRNTSLVFLNTMSNGHIQKALLFLKCKFICYVHELEAAIHIVSNKETLKVITENTNLFIACSNAVKENLITNHNIKKENIKVLNTSLTEVLRNKKDYSHFINSFKSINKIPADATIAGVAGTNEWRKGFDLFFPLINIYFNMFPDSNIYFVWKGFTANPSSFFDFYDYKKNNNNHRIFLLPHASDGIDTIACFDIHLLLSREDPYPLVVLEAASFGIPTICFSEAGGTPEFIEEDCGYCLPYGDLMQMAIKLRDLVQDTDLRNKMGLKAQEKVKARHASENAMPAFIELLEKSS